MKIKLNCLLRMLFAHALIFAGTAAPVHADEFYSYDLSLPRGAQLRAISSSNRTMDRRIQAIMNLASKDDSAALLFWSLTEASGSGRIPWMLIHGPSRIDWNKLGAELSPRMINTILSYALKNKMMTVFSETLELLVFLDGGGFTESSFLAQVLALTKLAIPVADAATASNMAHATTLLLERAHYEGRLKEEQILGVIECFGVLFATHSNDVRTYLPFGLHTSNKADPSRHLHRFDGAPGPWKNFEPNSHLIPDGISIRIPRPARLSFFQKVETGAPCRWSLARQPRSR